MTDFKPGDKVDITITGAKIQERLMTGVRIAYGSEMEYCQDVFLFTDVGDVTITRQAPKPQPGDVWRLNTGELVAVYRCGPGEHYQFLYKQDWGNLSKLDFTDAKLEWRPEPEGEK